LWRGPLAGDTAYAAVSSHRDRLLLAAGRRIADLESKNDSWDGNPTWAAETDWTIEGLYLNSASYSVAARLDTKVALLDRSGAPAKSCDLRAKVNAVQISPDGQYLLAGVADQRLVCLDVANLQTLWTTTLSEAPMSVAMGKAELTMEPDGVTTVAVVGGSKNSVFCVDVAERGKLICQAQVAGQVKSVAIGASHNDVLVGTEAELRRYDLTIEQQFVPGLKYKSSPGARAALNQLPKVANLFMNHDGDCIVVEVDHPSAAYHCLSLDGQPLWTCPRLQWPKLRARPAPRLPPIAIHTVSPSSIPMGTQSTVTLTGANFGSTTQVELQGGQTLAATSVSTTQLNVRVPGTLSPSNYVLTVKDQASGSSSSAAITVYDPRLGPFEDLKELFVQYVSYQKELKKRSAWPCRDVAIRDEKIDLYYDAKGYLFVPELDEQEGARARALAKYTDIRIITLAVTPLGLAQLSRSKNVRIYLTRIEWVSSLNGWQVTGITPSKQSTLPIGEHFESFMQLIVRRT